jgi:hypothetical protein
VRLALDIQDNTLLCALPKSFGGYHAKFSELAELFNVELFVDGNRWSTDHIGELTVWEINGGRFGAADSDIGRMTGQDGPVQTARLSKNGWHDFVLDHPVAAEAEYSGGLQRFQKPMELLEGLTLSSGDGRLMLQGSGRTALQSSETRVALSLAFGRMCRLRFCCEGRTVRLQFHQELQSSRTSDLIFDPSREGRVNHQAIQDGVSRVFVAALAAQRDSSSRQEDPTAEWLIQWFLGARSVEGLLDLRALCLFSFLEVIDHSGTLTGQSLSRLLGISLEHGKALTQVRNGISHGLKTLDEAIRDKGALDAGFFHDFLVGDFEENRPAPLFNFLVTSTNRLMLERIGCDLKPARWVN